MLRSTVSLDTGQGFLRDIQIWNNCTNYNEHKKLRLAYRCHVNYRRIPIFLVYIGASDVYTEDPQTECYFYNALASEDPEVGILAKVAGNSARNDKQDSYVVFFTGPDQHSIKCVFIDVLRLQNAQKIQQNLQSLPPEDVLYPVNLSEAVKSNTSVFDRVLESKSSKKSVTVVQPPVQKRSPSDLKSNSEIVSTINKVILSGLRLRGLSSSTSAPNEKYAVREIFQMTKQSTLFALRKFSYDFNESKGQKPTLETIQDIVESLLQTFVDIETTTFKEK